MPSKPQVNLDSLLHLYDVIFVITAKLYCQISELKALNHPANVTIIPVMFAEMKRKPSKMNQNFSFILI
jgi:hypothetical protein